MTSIRRLGRALLLACVLLALPAVARLDADVTSEYPLPGPFSMPAAITAGPDGALWFTEIMGNEIGRTNAVATPAGSSAGR